MFALPQSPLHRHQVTSADAKAMQDGPRYPLSSRLCCVRVNAGVRAGQSAGQRCGHRGVWVRYLVSRAETCLVIGAGPRANRASACVASSCSTAVTAAIRGIRWDPVGNWESRWKPLGVPCRFAGGTRHGGHQAGPQDRKPCQRAARRPFGPFTLPTSLSFHERLSSRRGRLPSSLALCLAPPRGGARSARTRRIGALAE